MASNLFMRTVGPGFGCGLNLSVWLRLLVRNRFEIGLPYIGRAGTISVAAILNSLWSPIEHLLYGRPIKQAKVDPPLFVLGAARSGTTHLHTLLSKDERFGFPNTFEVLNPRIFLSTEGWLAPFVQCFFPPTRPMDNMAWAVDSPAEDELALMGLSGLSPFACWLFPKNAEYYYRYLDFSEVPSEEQCEWKQTMLHFMKKLQCKYDKPMILKSPSHTPRVRLLHELFPDAKFVLIHRHPYHVYRSNLNLVRQVLPIATVQRYSTEEHLNRVIDVYRLYLNAYFEQRFLIPEGNLAEIGYEQLTEAPLETLRHVYDSLDLPPFEVAEPAVNEYVESIKGYEKNVYQELPAKDKSLIAREWRRSFDEWNYDP